MAVPKNRGKCKSATISLHRGDSLSASGPPVQVCQGHSALWRPQKPFQLRVLALRSEKQPSCDKYFLRILQPRASDFLHSVCIFLKSPINAIHNVTSDISSIFVVCIGFLHIVLSFVLIIWT